MSSDIFVEGKALQTTDVAFEASIYSAYDIEAIFDEDYKPKLIVSPFGSGKTTFLNYILLKVSEMYDESILVERIYLNEHEITDYYKFKRILAESIDSHDSRSIIDCFKQSKWIDQSGKKFLIFHDVDQMHPVDLEHFLNAIRGIHETEKALLESNDLQIIIEGTLSIQNLTDATNENFPLPQLHPPEFNEEQLRSFVEKRIENNFDEAHYDLLWQVTKGDKFITQSIMNQYTEVCKDQSVDNLEILQQVIDDYINITMSSDKLQSNIISGLIKIIKLHKSKFRRLKHFQNYLRDYDNQQYFVLAEEKKILFQHGFLRIQEYEDFQVRAPIVLKIFEKLLTKIRPVMQLFDLTYPKYVFAYNNDLYFNKYFLQILECISYNELESLHCGVGIVENGELMFEGTSYFEGIYTGVWDYGYTDLKDGDEYWCLAFKTGKGNRNKKAEVFIELITEFDEEE